MAYAEQPDLVIKHKQYLDMISWAKYDPQAKITLAVPCLMNRGTLDDKGNRAKLPARMYVNDAIMLALLKLSSKCHMKLVLATLIKAIFVIMGKPDTAVCQCPLAMDKWLELFVVPVQKMIGLKIDTNCLMVSIPAEYVAEVLDLINTTWHTCRRRFTVGETQKLTGKLVHLAEDAHWLFHLLTHVYSSIEEVLAENKRLLAEKSPSFREICLSINTGTFSCS
jgi:hypothetical protein